MTKVEKAKVTKYIKENAEDAAFFEENNGMSIDKAVELYEQDVLRTDDIIGSDEFAHLWHCVLGKDYKDYEYSYEDLAKEMNKNIAKYEYLSCLPMATTETAKRALENTLSEYNSSLPKTGNGFRVSCFNSLVNTIFRYERESFKAHERLNMPFKW